MTPRGLIQYNNISNFRIREALEVIKNSSKPKVGLLNMADILISGHPSDILLCDFNSQKVCGAGAYIFFENDIPVYVGKAKNFRNRLLSHLGNDFRANWAWCEAKKLIAQRDFPDKDILSLTDSDKELIHKKFLDWSVVRINIFDDEYRDKGYSKLESIFGKCYNATLLNNKFGSISNVMLDNVISNVVR